MPHASAGVCFKVDDVEPSPQLLDAAVHGFEELPTDEAIRERLGKGLALEACCPSGGRLIRPRVHGFAEAIHLAYAGHAPLVLSPDHVWLVIAQSLAAYLRLEPERWRGYLVQHADRKDLEVRDDSLPRRPTGEQWGSVVEKFVGRLASESRDFTRLLTEPFSTSGQAEAVACGVTLMHALQPFFFYRLLTVCGIPEIRLEGTVDDWVALRARAERLDAFGLGQWLECLLPTLDQFVSAARGEPDVGWWQQLYKFRNMSGGPEITGHIRTLLPFVGKVPNESTGKDVVVVAPLGRMLSEFLQSGVCVVPFVWRYIEEEIPMALVAGFVGVRRGRGEFFVRPEIGWAVCQRTETDNGQQRPR